MNGVVEWRSQFGEDRWIRERYEFEEPGVFVDVGASDGVTASNSLHFEQCGWYCLCIEPEPRHWRRLAETRKHVERVAISSGLGTQVFWQHPDRPTRSSLVPSEPVTYTPIVVNTVTLAELLNRHHIARVNILDIDVEGHEVAVWRSQCLERCRPEIVIIEYADSRVGGGFEDVSRVVSGDDYRLVHKTPANLIFECTQRPPRLRVRG